MLTGRKAFPGKSISERLAAVLNQEPDWNLLPADTPGPIRTLLARCLQKDAKRRLRDIGDARIELESAVVETTGQNPATFQQAGSRWKFSLGVGLGLVVVVVATLLGAIGWLRPGLPGSSEEAIRMSVMLPQGVSVTRGVGVAASLALSPDGRFDADT